MSVPADRLNRRTTSPAAIRRASKKARADLYRLDADTTRRLEQIYKRARAELIEEIEGYADTGGTLRLQVLQAMVSQINSRMTVLGRSRDELLIEGLGRAATIGTEPWRGAGIRGSLTGIADEAVRFVTTFMAEDGLQLADRLWRIDRGARELVTQAVEQAVIQGHSASQAAQAFLTRGELVPSEIANKLGIAQAGRVSRIAGDALMTGDGNPYDNALRVFRTETNRAHGEAYRASAFEHDDVVGMRFLLSPRHPAPDVCDMHASVNRYGLGPGVYPKGKSPWPAHPNTLSFEEPVFADEVTDADRAGKEDRIAWLKRQPPSIQDAVLGSRAKRGALERNLLRENHIRTPWRVLKKRYARSGVDVEQLPSRSSTASSPQAGVIAGAPVSNALRIDAYSKVVKRVTEAIDRVHSDGALPTIPVQRSQSGKWLAVYRHTLGGRAVDIRVAASGSHKELSLAHEIGHFIDHQGITPGAFASAGDRRFDSWRQAIESSAAVRRLRELAETSYVILPDAQRHRINRQHVAYLLEPWELWARSYAQYIAVRSGDQKLLGQLDHVLQRQAASAVNYNWQWQSEDFRSIAEAIDELFGELQWRKR
jgi:hypothetical protein